MNRFKRSNQNGAPSEIARAVNAQPRTLLSHLQNPMPLSQRGMVRASSQLQPIGSPSAWASAIDLVSFSYASLTSLSVGSPAVDAASVFLSLSAVVFLPALSAGAVGDFSAAFGFSSDFFGACLVASSAAATTLSRSLGSSDKLEQMAMVSAFMAIATTALMPSTHHCDRRLYWPG